MWSVIVLLIVGGTQAKRRLILNLGCADSQRSKPGDEVRLERIDGSFESLLLGPDPRSDWEGVCPGEIMEVNQEEVLVAMIVRRLKDAEGECGVVGGAGTGDTTTFTTRARIPTVIYLHYPHPTGDIPIKVTQRGQEGTTVDRSTDTVTLGTGSLPPGWEEGLQGTCIGDTRLLLLAPSMAFGARGLFHKIPPHAPLELTINMLSIERPSEPERPRSSVVNEKDPVIQFLRLGSRGELFSFSNSVEHSVLE